MFSKVNEKQRELFTQNGFLIAPFKIDSSLIDQVIAETLPHYQLDKNRGTIYPGQRIQDAWRTSKAVRQLALDPRILKLLRDLFGRKAFAFQTLNFQTGTQQRIHSDTIHFNSSPAGFMAGVWVALEDVDTGNGALKYYPGSHLLPEVTMQDVGVPAKSEHYRDYENFIATEIRNRGLIAAEGILKKGEVFIWHSNLLHGGGPHPELHRTRHSQVSHYYFEGCQYYTPMLSTKEQLHLRSPHQITHKMPYGTLDGYNFLKAKPHWIKKIWHRFVK